MRAEFTTRERLAAYGLLADHSTDIILKTDRRGFVLAASPALKQLGLALPAMLIGPHLRDIAHPDYRDLIESKHRCAVAGQSSDDWLDLRTAQEGRQGQWFEFQVRPMADHGGRIDGALVVMRCIARRKSLEERLFAAEFTDPLTRLTNRIAFVAMLDHLVTRSHPAALALFDIDHFMRLNMRFGQNAGDDLLIAFAGLLRAMTRSADIISRVGGERFAVIMPAVAPEVAAAACAPVVETFAEAGRAALGGNFAVSTSVGVAEITLSADHTVRQAELALFLAKAKGRSRIETAR
ncbi:sensor domain-containing diguanylate cyclase [Novosphingobium sp.]|uniref:GGDEF domain-containing protein n=1 Tax=Novosphingobium sp. TaxID=1874826 RepID=UPI002627776B|nr:sensor domain-containing diguanylate cyclase [Novosphingobium sp.]